MLRKERPLSIRELYASIVTFLAFHHFIRSNNTRKKKLKLKCACLPTLPLHVANTHSHSTPSPNITTTTTQRSSCRPPPLGLRQAEASSPTQPQHASRRLNAHPEQQTMQQHAPPPPSYGQGSSSTSTTHVRYPSTSSYASSVSSSYSSYPTTSAGMPVIPEAEREESEEGYQYQGGGREGDRVRFGGRKVMPPQQQQQQQQQEDHAFLSATHMINKQELNITQQQQSLAQEAASRHREVEEGMQALHSRIQAIDEKIKRAARERATAATRLQSKLEGKVVGLRKEWEGRVDENFDWILKEALPPLTSRLLDVEDSTQHFAHSILPPAIEASLLLEGGREGGVEAARKAWEAEKSKVKKREERIEQRLTEHVRKTAKGFEGETGTRLASLRNLEAEIRAPQLAIVDEEEGFQQQVKTTLRELYDGVAIEAQAREEEDCLVLDSMLEAQKALQRIILENYGGGRGGGGGGEGGGSFFLRLESCGEGRRRHEEEEGGEEGEEEWER